jgi:tetratricopeptide (TPR) repeat protein
MRRPHGLDFLLVSITCLGMVQVAQVTAFAQASGGDGVGGLSISGYVRDEDSHQSLKAVALELIGAGGTTASPAVMSGVNGEFRFGGVVSGEFRIHAHQTGYEPATVTVQLGGTPLGNVSVDLRRTVTLGTLEPGDAISTHQLSVPEKARDDFDKGMKLLVGPQSNYQKALSLFERAVKEFPDYYEAYAEMGVAHQHLGEEAEAEKALRKSVEMSSSRYADALFLLAEMLNDDGRFMDSEGFARQCVQQDDSSWSCDLELARALAGLKHPAEAEVVATRASELNPGNAKTFLVLGNIHIQQRKYEAVVKDFDTYLKLDPSGPASDSVRASQTQARRALEKASSAAPVPH